jgi:hypothetical protein
VVVLALAALAALHLAVLRVALMVVEQVVRIQLLPVIKPGLSGLLVVYRLNFNWWVYDNSKLLNDSRKCCNQHMRMEWGR